MKIKMILASDSNGVIGINGELPWKDKEEMMHFKTTTMNSIVVMGYNTFKSLNYKPLKGRVNYLLIDKEKSLDSFTSDEIKIVTNIDDVINDAENVFKATRDIYFIGGKYVYEKAIGYCDEIILSEYKYPIKFSEEDKVIIYSPNLDNYCLGQTKSLTHFVVKHYELNLE